MRQQINAHHHFMIATARTVGVEIPRLHAMFLQIFSGGAFFFDRACGRDVVGGISAGGKSITDISKMLDKLEI